MDQLAVEFAARKPLALLLVEADAGVDGAVGFDDACERRVGLFMFRELLLRGGLKRLDEVTLLHGGSERGSHYSPFPSSFSASVLKLSCVEVFRIRSKVSSNVTNDLVGDVKKAILVSPLLETHRLDIFQAVEPYP